MTAAAPDTPGVVAFSGHLVDAPGRTPPRFPPHAALEASVAAAIRTHLDSMNATVGYSSLANGSDILFAEAILARGAELHVVLPLPVADFLRTSVDHGLAGPPWDSWRRRFDAILEVVSQNHRLHHVATERVADDDHAFEMANAMLRNLAAARTAAPQALVVLDPASPSQPGGTRHFLEGCRAAGFRVHVIDLAATARTGRVAV